MATGLRLKYFDLKSELRLQELTGAYNVNSNPTGYGSPNLAVADVVSASIYITVPAGTTYTFNVSPSFPTSDVTDNPLSFTYAQLGFASEMAVGRYKIVYKLVDSSSNLYSVTYDAFLVGAAQCCLDSKYASFCYDDVEAVDFDAVGRLYFILQAAKDAAEDCLFDRAEYLASYVHTQCSSLKTC